MVARNSQCVLTSTWIMTFWSLQLLQGLGYLPKLQVMFVIPEQLRVKYVKYVLNMWKYEKEHYQLTFWKKIVYHLYVQLFSTFDHVCFLFQICQ